MTLTARDKKIALILAPVLLVGAFWFLLMSPKRAESAKLEATLVQEEQKRDEVKGQADLLENARRSYAKDYATIVRLGKAVPSSVDMPSLLVQLEQAAKGTSIRFSKVLAGTRADAPVPPPPPAPATGGGSAPAAPAGDAAAGGAEANTAPGGAAETAGEGVQDANATSAASEGTAPPAAGATDPAAATTSGAAGLDSLPLEFSFRGRFFDLADFFHEMKRFVYLSNTRVRVEGRLMTIDGFTIDSSSFPTIKADVRATVYLAPKSQGTTAGATPTAPAPAPGATAPVGEAAPAPPPTPAAAQSSSSGGVQ